MFEGMYRHMFFYIPTFFQIEIRDTSIFRQIFVAFLENLICDILKKQKSHSLVKFDKNSNER